MELHKQIADNLLMVIWRGIPNDYKSRYRMSIWKQFEDQIRSAAYTSNLGKFVNSLCSKLGAELGRNADDRDRAMAFINGADDRTVLKLLRDETTLLVLMVRVTNQERKDEYEKEHARNWED